MLYTQVYKIGNYCKQMPFSCLSIIISACDVTSGNFECIQATADTRRLDIIMIHSSIKCMRSRGKENLPYYFRR